MFCFRSKLLYKTIIYLFSVYTSLFKNYFCEEFIEIILEAFSMFSVSGVSGVSGISGVSGVSGVSDVPFL